MMYIDEERHITLGTDILEKVESFICLGQGIRVSAGDSTTEINK